MTASRSALAAAACTVLALGACTSARFGDVGPGPLRSAQPLPPPQPDPVEAVPSGPVTSAPLPPPDGTGPVVAPGMGDTIAALPPGPAPLPSATPAPSGRSTVVGGWTARAAGASCRVQLSSTPALDLYRATTNGCSSDLSKITAWDYREGEVYLYQSGGTVAARLRAGEGGLSGVLTKSGAPVTLAR